MKNKKGKIKYTKSPTPKQIVAERRKIKKQRIEDIIKKYGIKPLPKPSPTPFSEFRKQSERLAEEMRNAAKQKEQNGMWQPTILTKPQPSKWILALENWGFPALIFIVIFILIWILL